MLPRLDGLTLGRRPQDIRIGDVIRLTEPDFALVECFATGNRCTITQCCKLSGMLHDALSDRKSVV